MTATAIDLSAIKTDALSAASTFRTLIGLGTSATLNAGSANGVATLGADSKLTAAQIPDISLISYLGSVASQAAMLALTGQQGDWCVRSDLSTTWVITGSDPTLIANWTQLSYPSVPVQSVFGRTGAVVGVSTDYSSVGITNTAIGATNPSTGAFTTLSANSATLSAGTLNGTVLDVSQTWGGTGTYTGLKYNVTDSGPSNAASLLMDLQVGGTSRFKVDKVGTLTLVGGGNFEKGISFAGSYGSIALGNGGSIVMYGGAVPRIYSGSTNGQLGNFELGGFGSTVQTANFAATGEINWNADTKLFRDAANTLAQRNGTSAQTFRIYKTYTDATNNFERGKIGWSGDVFQIGTEKGLTSGAARALELQTDGVTRLSIGITGYETQFFQTILCSAARSTNVNGNNSTYGYNGVGISDFLSYTIGYRNGYPTDNATGTLSFVGNSAYSSATTNIVGGNVLVTAGNGAASSAGAANGGHVYLDGGQGYGTGVHGSIIIGATRARLLAFGGTTSSFPAIKRNSAALNFRLADDSGDCDITAKAATFSGNVTVSAVNIVTDTTTGTKIGTATNQKLGFYDKTPVVQPTAVADATDAASVITQLNLLLARMRDLGLIAT